MQLQQKEILLEKSFEFFKNIPLFYNIKTDEIDYLLKCLDAKFKTYYKNDFIILADDDISFIGLIIRGSIHIISEDSFGERNIIAKLSRGNLFAEAFVCAGVKKSPISVMAVEECKIMTIEFNRIITTCPNSCSHHSSLIENMIKILSNKNLMLNNKIDILSKRSIREKLLAYFSILIKENKSNNFSIPFSRDELADFLCVNRSALSREITNMKNDGLIDFNRNNFTVFFN